MQVHKQTDRQTSPLTHTDTDTQTQTHRHTHTDTDTDRHMHAHAQVMSPPALRCCARVHPDWGLVKAKRFVQLRVQWLFRCELLQDRFGTLNWFV